MACVNADGTLSESGKVILKALASPSTAEEIAAATGLPLYRIRSALREMAEAGLAAGAEGVYQSTEAGKAKSE